MALSLKHIKTNEEWPYSLNLLLNDMRLNQQLTDVTLVCNGGQVEAHRNVLSSRSIYFKNLFLGNFQESQTKDVDFSPIDVNLMNVIVDYVYLNFTKGIKKKEISTVLKIHHLAQLFGLEGLKNHVWKIVMESLGSSNCIKIWGAIQVYGEEKNVSQIFNFILNHLQEITEQTQNFNELSLPQIILLVDEIRKNNVAVGDLFVDEITKWAKINHFPASLLEVFLLPLNFEKISREYMTEVTQNKHSIFGDSFFKKYFIFHTLPKFKTKDEILTTDLYKTSIKTNIKVPVFFYFTCYKGYWNGDFVNLKASLRVTDIKFKYTIKSITNLPFSFGDELFIPIQHRLGIYLIGCVMKAHRPPHPNLSFLFYDWQKNTISAKQNLLNEVAHPHVCVIGHKIYLVENQNNVTRIQWFDTRREKWEGGSCEIGKVVECVNFHGALSLLCMDKIHRYALYKVHDKKFYVTCKIPLPEVDRYWWDDKRWCSVRLQNSIAVFKNKFYVFMFSTEKEYSRYWVSPWNKWEWQCEQLHFTLSKWGDMLQSHSSFREGILFYNKSLKKIFIFNEMSDPNVKEFTDVQCSLEETDVDLQSLGFTKFEMLLF